MHDINNITAEKRQLTSSMSTIHKLYQYIVIDEY